MNAFTIYVNYLLKILKVIFIVYYCLNQFSHLCIVDAVEISTLRLIAV